ncbi:MAG TPA: AAA family ATPase [Terriglobia bacterium]|nr:AAA family ATPase [Terriglobia bacterium]
MLLKIRNFRAIQGQEIELAPITVVYGANGAGKSSLLYALLTLKAAILNSNSATSAFFNYGFTSLGGFEAVVFDHKVKERIEVALQIEKEGGVFEHGVEFGETQGAFKFSGRYHSRLVDKVRLAGDGVDLGVGADFNVDIQAPVTFPYAGNQPVTVNLVIDEQKVSFTWNGITAQLPAGQSNAPEVGQTLSRVIALVNGPAEVLRKVTMVPLRRGFSKPIYQTQPLTAALISEDEVATFLSTNKYLVSKISHYLERVLQQDFRVNVQPGTAIFSLDATDKDTGVATELVNEGFGVNQMVYFLAKALNSDVDWTCIEEPEIHLHPTAVRGFSRALGEMVNKEGKSFIASTHSEAFVLALLSLVAEQKLKPEQLAFYFVHKEGKRAVFERQVVHDNGQIEGGLTSFMGGELQDYKSLLQSTR